MQNAKRGLLLYPDEIRVDPAKELPAVKVSKQELDMAGSLIDMMSQDFHPEEYTDHYREALTEMIQAKLEGEEVTKAPSAAPTKVVDLMDALRASVESAKSSRSKKPQEQEEKQIASIKKQAAHRKSPEKGVAVKRPVKKKAASNQSKRMPS